MCDSFATKSFIYTFTIVWLSENPRRLLYGSLPFSDFATF